MTTEPAGREFVGEEAIIEGIRVSRRSEETSRMHVTLSLPIKPQNADLRNEMELQLKNRIFFGVGFMQEPIRFPDDEPATPTGNGTTVTMTVDGQDGQTVKLASGVVRHIFHASDEDVTICLFCRQGELAAVHISMDSGEALSMAEAAVVQAHVEGNEELVERLITDSREAFTEESAEAPATGGEMPPVDDTPPVHAFQKTEGDNQCGICHLGEDNPVHLTEDQAQAREKISKSTRTR